MICVQNIVYVLDADRRFTYANAYALETWQRQVGQVLGQSFEDGLPIRRPQDVIDTVQRAIRSQERTEVETFDRWHRAWIGVTLSPDAGGVIGSGTPSAAECADQRC